MVWVWAWQVRDTRVGNDSSVAKMSSVEVSHRIQDGLTGGRLTYREAQRLRHHQQQIQQMRRHFLADGHLSHRERQILDQRLDRNSDRIYALKHNRRYHPDRRWYGYYR